MADDTKKELRSKMIYQVFVRNYSEDGIFASVERDLDRIKSLGTDFIVSPSKSLICVVKMVTAIPLVKPTTMG